MKTLLNAQLPERFVRRAPTPPPVPVAAWINKPDTEEVLTKFERQPSHST